jgi:hypothetical protein
LSTALRQVVARGRGQGAFQASIFAENLRTAFDGAEYLPASATMSTTYGLRRLDALRWPPPVGLGIDGIPWTRREMTEQKMIVFKT